MKKNLGNTPVVAPLPVLIVATYDEHGTPNAMNVAWGGQCGYHYVALNLSLNHKTTENLKHTEAFTLSIATVDTLVLSDYFGLVSGRKENKIEKAGVHVTRSAFVNAPVIDEYPLTLECKVVEMQEALGEMHVIGEVVNMLADESVFIQSSPGIREKHSTNLRLIVLRQVLLIHKFEWNPFRQTQSFGISRSSEDFGYRLCSFIHSLICYF